MTALENKRKQPIRVCQIRFGEEYILARSMLQSFVGIAMLVRYVGKTPHCLADIDMLVKSQCRYNCADGRVGRLLETMSLKEMVITMVIKKNSCWHMLHLHQRVLVVLFVLLYQQRICNVNKASILHLLSHPLVQFYFILLQSCFSFDSEVECTATPIHLFIPFLLSLNLVFIHKRIDQMAHGQKMEERFFLSLFSLVQTKHRFVITLYYCLEDYSGA